MTAKELSTDMSGWMVGTKHYRIGTDQYVAVEVDQGRLPEGVEAMFGEILISLDSDLQGTKIILRPTTIIECDEDGQILGNSVPEPSHTFPPGTSYEEALTLAGLS